MREPIYLCVPSGPLHQTCLETLGRDRVTPVTPGELGGDAAETPGVVLLGPTQLTVAELVGLAERLYAAAEGWRLCVVRGGEAPSLQVLSVGHPEPLGQATAAVEEEGDPGALMELRRLLREVSRARHDINNPLTSALAEVQLLLMDVPQEGEVREGLEVTQEQLRRIRDLVADTGHIRPPRGR